MLGRDEQPADIEAAAEKLMVEHQRSEFADEVKHTNIQQWAEEGVPIALKTVYQNLDPNITTFPDRPVGYETDATRVARRRAALAGYRLADELKRLFPPD